MRHQRGLPCAAPSHERDDVRPGIAQRGIELGGVFVAPNEVRRGVARDAAGGFLEIRSGRWSADLAHRRRAGFPRWAYLGFGLTIWSSVCATFSKVRSCSPSVISLNALSGEPAAWSEASVNSSGPVFGSGNLNLVSAK